MASHISKRRNILFARLNIPADVQPAFNGRKIFIASTKEADPKRANAVAAPMIAAWQRRIDEARLLKPDPAKAEIDRMASAYRRRRSVTMTKRQPHSPMILCGLRLNTWAG